jgi:hypothetical protein
MKLQELLRKCDFDRMFEYIVKFDPKSEGSRFAKVAQAQKTQMLVDAAYLHGGK